MVTTRRKRAYQGDPAEILIEVILERRVIEGSYQLYENELRIRCIVKNDPDSCRDLPGQPPALSCLLSSPHNHQLVEFLASACPYVISCGFIKYWCFSEENEIDVAVKEVIIHHYHGLNLDIRGVVEDTALMAVRAADVNPHIETVALDSHGISPRVIAAIGATTSLKNVYLKGYVCYQPLVFSAKELNSSLSSALRHNNSIETLSLEGDYFDTSICSGITKDNTTLKSLVLNVGKEDDDLTEVAHMLKRNRFLSRLEISPLNDAGALSLAKGLAANRSLKSIYCYTREWGHVRKEGTKALVESLSSYNTTLKHCHVQIDGCYAESRLKYYCALNRAGRGLIRDNACPKSDFVDILYANIDNSSIIYGLLVDVPHRWLG